MAVFFTKRAAPAVAQGTPASDFEVGSSVFLEVNGSPTEFLIVHQGLPSSIYDSSCDGTWLLMKDVYESRPWHSSNVNDYANSTIHAYLNGDFFNLLGSAEQASVKQVKIPYRAGSGVGTTVSSGANGLSTKIFLLSAAEASVNYATPPTNEGVELYYFAGCSDDGVDDKRVAYLNGATHGWYLRSPSCISTLGTKRAITVIGTGKPANNDVSSGYGIRPALILPSTSLFDANHNFVGGGGKS